MRSSFTIVTELKNFGTDSVSEAEGKGVMGDPLWGNTFSFLLDFAPCISLFFILEPPSDV